MFFKEIKTSFNFYIILLIGLQSRIILKSYKAYLIWRNCIQAIALNKSCQGKEVLIHRMDMNPSENKLPFNMTRRQFPVIISFAMNISFAMTINKSQGQSMSTVGLYLPSPIFSHGQLYVALSRVKMISVLKILIFEKDKRSTSKTISCLSYQFSCRLTFYQSCKIYS